MKKKETRNVVIGILLMGAGLYGMSLKIDNTGHYFGTGTIFGIGLSMVGNAAIKSIRKKR